MRLISGNKTEERSLTPVTEHAEKVEAAPEAISLSQETASKDVIEHLVVATEKRRKYAKWFAPSVISAALSVGTAIAFTAVTGLRGSVWSAVLAAAVIGSYVGIGAGLVGGLERLRRAALNIQYSQDIRAVGPLVKALSCGETAYTVAGSALIRLLPNVTCENCDHLSLDDRREMRAALLNAIDNRQFYRYDPVLACAMLNAMQRIADPRDESTIDQVIASLERRKASYKNSEISWARMYSAARSCRNALRAGTVTPEAVERPTVELSDTYREADVQQLAQNMEKLLAQRRRNLISTVMAAGGGITLAAMRLSHVTFAEVSSAWVVGGLILSAVAMVRFGAKGIYAQRNLLNEIVVSTDDLTILPVLCRSAASGEISGGLASTALTPLLQRIGPDNTGYLNAEARQHLHTAMRQHEANRAFLAAGLAALYHAGDASSIPIVERYLQRTTNDKSPEGVQIHDLAATCLDVLRIRAEAEQAADVLLRASDQGDSPDHLLRASVAGSEKVSELLQPAAACDTSEQPL